MLEYGMGNNWISTCIIMLKIYRMKWTWWTLNTVVLVDKTLQRDRDRWWGFLVSQKLHERLCKWRNPTIRNWKLQPFWVFFWTSSQCPIADYGEVTYGVVVGYWPKNQNITSYQNWREKEESSWGWLVGLASKIFLLRFYLSDFL